MPAQAAANPMYPLLIAGIVGLSFMLIVYALVLRSRQRDPMKRLDTTTPQRFAAPAAREKKALWITSFFNRRMAGSTFAENTARMLSQADVRLTPGEFLGIRLGAAALGALFAWLLVGSGVGKLIGIAVLALAGFMVPKMVVGFRKRRRVNAFSLQLADSTMMLANSLRAGYSLLQSMDVMTQDAPEPTATEFRRVVQEVGVGLSLNEALANMLRRVPSDDLDLLVTAISIQQEVGGNLSQVLEGISNTIRQRVKIKGDIRTLTAQGRYSGYLVTAVPFIVAFMLYLLNRDYLSPLWSWPWMCMPIASLVMIFIAYLLIMKIVNIEV